MRRRTLVAGVVGGLAVAGLGGCRSAERASSEPAGAAAAPAAVGTVTAEQDFRWPADEPEHAAGALIDRLAEMLDVDEGADESGELHFVVEERTARGLTVRLDLTDHLERAAAGEDAVFRYTWTAEPGADAAVIHARSEYLGSADMSALPANDYAMYPNFASMAVMGMMMAPR